MPRNSPRPSVSRPRMGIKGPRDVVPICSRASCGRAISTNMGRGGLRRHLLWGVCFFARPRGGTDCEGLKRGYRLHRRMKGADMAQSSQGAPPGVQRTGSRTGSNGSRIGSARAPAPGVKPLWALRKARGDAASERSRRGRSDEEVETQALVAVQRALGPLAPESRTRVLRWFAHVDDTGGEIKTPAVQPTFQDLAALFEAIRPKSDVDRTLAACYFRNEVLKEPDVGAVT